MKFPRAAQRFLLGYLILHLLAAGLFVLVLTRMVRNQMIFDARLRMSAMNSLLKQHIDELEDGLDDDGLPAHVTAIGKETQMRFTLIKSDGAVVADSVTGIKDIGDHGSREEVVLAKEYGSGFSQRYSSTLNQQMMYFAQKYDPKDLKKDSGFVRVATPYASISTAVSSVQKYVWWFAISLSALTGFVMAIFAAKSMRPLTTFSQAARRIGVGDYDVETPNIDHKDEWAELGDAFQQMRQELNTREVSLIENNQRLEAVLSSMIEGVIAIEPDGKVMLANGAACDMLSLTRPELVGRRLLEIVRNPKLRTAVENTQLKRTFTETEFETLSDPQKTISARVSVLADTNRSGVAIVLHDVTELRQLETMRQDFVANVSHELKTPLAAIKAYAETLKLGALYDNENNMEFVEQIESSAELLNRQIQDLLQLARVESGEKTFSVSGINLNEIAEDCHSQFARVARDHRLELLLELHDPAPFTKADRDAVETIVRNLVVNAIHYTPEQGTVTIKTEIDGNWVAINVIDTGIGIAPDQQTRVFERFYRVDKARSRDMGGTGLGLSIVKHLSLAFGGTVSLKSQLGKGSTFRVQFPAGKVPTDQKD